MIRNDKSGNTDLVEKTIFFRYAPFLKQLTVLVPCCHVPMQISVVSACLVGLLQVLESLCTKLHSLAHTIAMSADVLQLLSSLLPGHMSQLIAAGQEELMKQTASSLVSAIKQMKEGKVS